MLSAQATFMRPIVSAIVLIVAWAHPVLCRAQASSHPEELIQQAIRWGSQGRPAPYQLIWRTGEQEERTTVVGAVYTPFVRVAMWVHEQQKADRASLSVTDIPSELLDPTLMIALRQEPSCCPPVEPGPPVQVCAVLVPAPSRHMLVCEDALAYSNVEPAQVTTNLAALRRFDPETADRTSAILVFPLESIRSGRDVVYELHRREAGGSSALHFVGFGMIRQSDIAVWR
jgi:hypothetical protein